MQNAQTPHQILTALLVKHRTLVGLDGAHDPELRAAEDLAAQLKSSFIGYASPRAMEYAEQFGQLNLSKNQTILKPEAFLIVKL